MKYQRFTSSGCRDIEYVAIDHFVYKDFGIADRWKWVLKVAGTTFTVLYMHLVALSI